ncbi:MAG TPA: hydroxymethylbilane synthase [Candidatus Binatia bacterium]|jgi:hydroxymethylbilane synthase|nr:hydroxymethylbilane synthase [Candidatus Binatia bacterium]
MTQPLRIGTRGSALALWQAGWVKIQLENLWSGLQVELVPIKTSGDKLQDVSLAQIGGKGLFVKEIEEALLAETIDLAVHSVKDLPAELPKGLTLSAIPEREDPRDVLITRQGETLAELPAGTRVGTSSLRRQALLLHVNPGLRVEMLRGNVDTRLRKQREGVVDAIVLAVAGLKRLGLAPKHSQVLDEQVFLPAIGQGALGIETRVNDKAVALVRLLHHEATAVAINAERSFLNRMGGSCRTPLAAKGLVLDDRIHLAALVASPDGRRVIRGEHTGPSDMARQVGATLAEKLLAQGGKEILEELERGGYPSRDR